MRQGRAGWCDQSMLAMLIVERAVAVVLASASASESGAVADTRLVDCALGSVCVDLTPTVDVDAEAVSCLSTEERSASVLASRLACGVARNGVADGLTASVPLGGALAQEKSPNVVRN